MSDLSFLKPGRIVDLIEADFPPEPCWVGPDVIPKRCKVIFGGAAAIGKSFFMLSLARALALGETPFECPRFSIDKPAKVLMIEHELKPYGLQKRVKPIFADVDKNRLVDTFWYVSGEPSLHFSSHEGYAKMTSLVEEVKPDVLMLDPIGKMHYENENDNAAVSRLMYKIDLLLRIGADWGMSCVFSHHFGKTPAVIDPNAQVRDSLDAYNYRGAAKWFDDPDIRITLAYNKRLPVDSHKAWLIDTRWITRQDEGHPDMRFAINADGDSRVKFVDEVNPVTGKTPPPKIPPQKPPGGSQCPTQIPSATAVPTSGFAPAVPGGKGLKTYR